MTAPPTGEQLLDGITERDLDCLPVSGLAGLPEDEQRRREMFDFWVRVPKPTANDVWLSIRRTRRPAGVLVHPGMHMLFVASSRLGVVWLFRQLVSAQGGALDIDWAKLALVADAADRCGSEVGSGDEEEEEGGTEGDEGGEEGEEGGEEGEESGRERDEEGEEGEESGKEGEESGKEGEESGKEGDHEGGEDEDAEADEEGEDGNAEVGKGGAFEDAIMCTQERLDREAWLQGRRDARRVAQLSKPGALHLTVGNNIGAAERARKRKREAEARREARRLRRKTALSDEIITNSSMPDGGEEDDALAVIPKPTEEADPAELRAWARLKERDDRTQMLIVRIKRELEGEHSGWRERRGRNRRRGRPAKGEEGEKVMSYSVADKWLTAAESIGRGGTLDEFISALSSTRADRERRESTIPDAQQASEVIHLHLADGPSPDASMVVASTSTSEGQQQQLVLHGTDPSPVRRGIERLRAAADQLRGSCARLALSVAQTRLRKAYLANVFDDAVVAIKTERELNRERQASGPSGHARAEAKRQLERALEHDEELGRLFEKHRRGARRWQRFGNRLGYGAILMSGHYDLSDRFIEKDLNDLEFDQWLNLAAEVHAGALETADQLWKSVRGKAMMKKGDFSLETYDPATILNAVVATSQRAVADGTQPDRFGGGWRWSGVVPDSDTDDAPEGSDDGGMD